MWLKACPRCRGDLYPRHEPEGMEITCIQCSRIFNPRQLIHAMALDVPLATTALVELEADAEAEVEEEAVPAAA